MLKGRIVRIREHDGPTASVLRVFYVGIEHEDTAINAVLAAFPEYEGASIEANERLSGTAASFLDLGRGEVRDRSEEQAGSVDPTGRGG